MVETDPSKHLIFHEDTPKQAAEFFRLAVSLLGKNKISTTPVNFSLFYNYVAGRNVRLKEKIDKVLEEQGGWSSEKSNALFLRFIHGCDEVIMEELRGELLALAEQMINSLGDITSRTQESSRILEEKVEKLSKAKGPKEAVQVVSDVITEARNLMGSARELEVQLVSSSDEMVRLKEELQSAREAAYVDSLTSILNRRGFDKSLSEMIAGSDKVHPCFCMVMCDIDHFKEINDNFGHLVGDNVLRAIAQVLTKHIKGKDFACRFGGEEFALLLPETKITAAYTLSEDIRSSVEKLILKRPSTGESLGKITMSFGVAAYRAEELEEVFLDRCDKAMYRAKKLGRNRVVLSD